MPTIQNIDVPLFDPNDPYHFNFDNIPFRSLITRQNLINAFVDKNSNILRDAVGTAGTLQKRLDRSLDSDGTLKAEAINEAEHSIEYHIDTSSYVRMTTAERAKLDLIQDEATDVTVQVQIDELENVFFDEGTVKFLPSESIQFTVDNQNEVKIHTTFPPETAHVHFYDREPVPYDLDNPDNINFKVNVGGTEYIEESLRVYINGVRLVEDEDIYVPGRLVDDPWTLLSFSSDYENGSFALSSAIQDEDIIRIDYDIKFF